MYIIISPARHMKTGGEREAEITKKEITVPAYRNKAKVLAEKLKKYQPWELESILKVNEKLGIQAFMDYQDMNLDREGSPALFTYDGLVYKHIAAEKLSREQALFANRHLRILSAFYGILQPFDGIHPYRLEFISRFKINGQNLYRYWQDEPYQNLYQKGSPVINLASEEYARCIRKYLMPADLFIDVEFLVCRNRKQKTITTWAKMARGKMVRYIIEKNITEPEKLKEFSEDGYQFCQGLSDFNKYVFIKDYHD